jgi:DNA-binding MarR family transcriptional regulator
MQAYLDLIDTADWLRAELHGPLASFGLTMGEYRLLELLKREGALPVPEAARRRKSNLQNMKRMIEHLEERGWVGRVMVALPPVDAQEGDRPKPERGGKWDGRRVSVVALTAPGKKFVREVLPRHTKLVKSLFRALDGREHVALSRMCQKLRKGDVLKFFDELRNPNEEE